MKRIISFFALFLLFTMFAGINGYADDITLVVNGDEVDLSGDQPPIVQNDSVLVPFRPVLKNWVSK